ncbi:MAG TPA: DUF2461 domain-containing protein [Candidatus Eisenbergiella merdavium]|uniref:DUF2461 domain-containing protein n=1 Tax=Candidatus Eisenbergiella merdavium TaxID=2838551 RepID=A0A9D2SQ11_9FIRM|nr:DUF2461 domain-containing protein [Candidatus Eisenbergiella merdavium]
MKSTHISAHLFQGMETFHGFNEATVRYYEAIRKDNSRNTHKENEHLYLKGVKEPLDALYDELYRYFDWMDSDLLSGRRQCISSAYNDARFCRSEPMKEYFYLRFWLNKDGKNMPGFFFDASLDGCKYGLNIYHPDAAGMERIRNHILDNKWSATEVIEEFNEAGLLEVRGEKYKRPHYPEADEVLRDWLERKRISFIHEECLNGLFFERGILECIEKAFESAERVYFLLKEAL